jgi:hypothetical protein
MKINLRNWNYTNSKYDTIPQDSVQWTEIFFLLTCNLRYDLKAAGLHLSLHKSPVKYYFPYHGSNNDVRLTHLIQKRLFIFMNISEYYIMLTHFHSSLRCHPSKQEISIQIMIHPPHSPDVPPVPFCSWKLRNNCKVTILNHIMISIILS